MPIILANIFQPLINVFESVLVFIHDNVVVGSWGLAIVALTILVRALLLPLTLKQVKSMQALQRLAPEIKLLQEKYKGDKQRLNQEMMKFYQENKVNPFGSCLPLAAQLPVFLALFYMLRKELKLDICGRQIQAAAHLHANASAFIEHTGCDKVAPHSAKFLFIPDITTPAVGAVLIVLIVLYVGSQLASSLLMSVTADRNQRLMMIGLPFLFTFFILGFPAGLIVYWITTNCWTIVQQFIVRRSAPPPPRVPATSPTETGGGLLARLSAAAGGAPKPAQAPAGPTPTRPPPSPRKKKKRSGRRR